MIPKLEPRPASLIQAMASSLLADLGISEKKKRTIAKYLRLRGAFRGIQGLNDKFGVGFTAHLVGLSHFLQDHA